MTPESGPNTIKDGPEFERRKALVRQKIDIWKKHLLDLTRRNRLLFFTASRTNTVQIISPAPEELFEQLVVRGRQLSFPIPRRDRQLDLENINDPSSESVLYEGSKAGDLETSSPVRDLQTKLYRLRRELRTWQEEQGVHTLFLALGMLHWREAEYEQEECLAPLVLVPVGLEKEGTDKPYAIECVEEDIVINPALAYKLEIDQGIKLPELPEEPQWPQIEQFLNNVSKQVKPIGWHLTTEAWLGRFSFEKFVMYRDLEELKEAAALHPIVAALAGASSLPPPTHLPGIDDMDTLIDPKEVFPVLDADSSQLEVLIRARSEQNLVVQGPPGTGKSQTIVNLIAQALKDAKKILFVSEKMAALEVVFRRLKEAGLSFACLEVHSHRSNKAKVIEELGTTLQRSSAGRVPMDAADRFDRLVRRRELLNQYVKELHKPRGALSLTAYNVHGQLAKYSSEPDVDFKQPLELAQHATSENLDNWSTAILAVAAIPEVWNNYSYHPWLGADIDPKTYTIEQRDSLVLAVKEVRSLVERIETLTRITANKLGLADPASLEDCKRFLKILEVLDACVPVAEIWLQLTLPTLENYLTLAREAEKRAGRLAEGFNSLRTIFKEGVLELPVDTVLGRFQGKYRSVLRWTKRAYWQDLKILKEYWVGPRRIKFQAVLRGLEAASLVISERGWFAENEPRCTTAFAGFYKGPGSDWRVIITGLEWVSLLKKHLPKGEIPTRLSTLALDPKVLQTAVRQPLSDLRAIIESFGKYYHHLEKIYRSYRIQGHEISKAPFDILKPWLDSKADPKDLDDWVSFLRARDGCNALGLSGFLEAALSTGIKANRLEKVFLRRFWKFWTAEVHRDSPPLNEFRKQRHEEIIGEFRVLDRDLKKITAALVQEEIQKRQPKREEARVKESQVGILLREMQKKRRHRPLRKLFAEIPDLLQALKPCLLMSPLSVAAYLGQSACRFDVVIFDEASQIPPEDAIGAILRGSQLIVAGDSKQLPPTKFFQVDIDPDEEEDAVDQAPLESILDECEALPVGFQPAPLTWHYRSRYEELIAFSNRQFYGSSLVTFPSPYAPGSSGSIRFVYVPEGTYDRGGSRSNRIEAKKVVDLLADHLRNSSNIGSVGIITLSLAQEEAVLQEWERRITLEPDLAASVAEEGDEPLFIKALEKVQGDERDFIFMSIAYGPDQNRVIHMNFGPINRSGGERRLNVAVTRARLQSTVVSSMLPHELDLARVTTGHAGVAALQKYLEYAKNGGTFSEETYGSGVAESDFELSVKEALESHGHRVDPQVGFSGFRIDLGVRHPDFPSRYILGIECDGATYHSHRTARDRDRLRQEVLTRLGWQIHRIWSTDWIRDPATALRLTIQRINDLRTRGISGVSVPKDPPKSNPGEKPGQSPNSSIILTDPCIRAIPRYNSYIAQTIKPSEWLYEAESPSKHRHELFADIMSVVIMEAPIHFQALCSRIREIYKLQRAGSRVQEIIEGILTDRHYRSRFDRRGDFIWEAGQFHVEPRAPREEERPRPVEWVVIEELAAAAEWLLEVEFGMPREALIKETARIMGYERTGANVEDRISKAVDFLLKEKRVRESNGQIVPNRETNQ